MPDQYDDIQGWATIGGGEGDPAASSDLIQAHIEEKMANLGMLHDTLDEIPDTASERSNGTFTDLNDLIRYLDGGALIFRDESGDFVPNPIVHILHWYDEDTEYDIYSVWIDEES